MSKRSKKDEQKEEDVQNIEEVNLNNVAVEERNKLQEEAEDPTRIDESIVDQKVQEVAEEKEQAEEESKEDKGMTSQQWTAYVDKKLRENEEKK